MGSLNGDVHVMRNGRSTSQVSVYNYPEHLNPFYEDDQHKRLRFWKINKKDNEGRRNSFSISNLKDIWAFKSFRMKKKSSTLGINKTSESPPTLRREFVVDNGWNTFDHRLRANNTLSMNDESFQRNATYRSSLQTLPTSNDRMGLNRNDGYRSTIQVTRSKPRYQPQSQQKQQTTTALSPRQRRYVYGGSVTPQPLRNTNSCRGSYEHDCDMNTMIRGSSQSSMVSTNPFDTDNEDDNEDINSSGMKSVNGGSTSTLTSRTPRKKRRAPAPPTPIHGRSNGIAPPTILIESSQDNNQDELRIREDMDIANLTAEIESFVKTKDNDNVEDTNVKDKVKTETKVTAAAIKPPISDDKEIVNKNQITTKTSNISSTTITNKEEIQTTPKSNDQVTTEIVTVTTITNSTPSTKDVNKPLERKHNVTKVTNETKTIDESKEVTIKSNGAIPKKPNNNTGASSLHETQNNVAAGDLCIKEINTKEEMPQKPVPVKRQTKPETEVGQVECIHVHVESPRSKPRLEHTITSGVSSFKTEHTETEKITTKTPFILTSPPTRRRKDQPTNDESSKPQKEPAKILEDTKLNERINELNIIEEKRNNTKPEIIAKPILSPKPVIEANGKPHTFAEIHKPIRCKLTNTQNGHIRRASKDEIIPPPIVPVQKSKCEKEEETEVLKVEKKIINSAPIQIHLRTEKTPEDGVEIEKKTDSLEIVETFSNNTKEEQNSNNATGSVTIDNNTKELRREMVDEFDLLYRPKPPNHMEWKHSSLAPLETHIPPEKRKSVKDIIESINRSQRLLHAAANKDFTTLVTTTEISKTSFSSSPSSQKTVETNNKNNCNENLKILDESEIEFQRLVDELEPATYNGNAANSASSSPNFNNEYLEAQKLDNDIFQKCKVKKEVYDYRESSPISSNLDWNPVPKPKRTKPLQE